MTQKIVVGVSGKDADQRALAVAKRMAGLIGECEIVLAFVIEWSPFSFQTPEENAQRHKRREEEISLVRDRVLAPIESGLKSEGFAVSSQIRHGDAAEILNAIALKEHAEQIVVTRSTSGSISARVFGTVATKLAATASVPVTIVG